RSIMSRFRTHLMALLGGAMLLALSISGALGHASSGDFGGGARNHGQTVSDFVHSLAFGDEDAAEEEPADEGDVADDTEGTDTEDTDTEDTEDTEDTDADEDADTEDAEEDPAGEDADSEDADTEDAEAGAHGACVSEVAHSDEVGGPNENHGGAVSLAARETCWEDPAEEPTDGDSTEDESTDGSAVDADASEAKVHDRNHGRSGDHRGGGHAHGRSGDRG
ncbi:MAG: hypothetical protein ABIZ71_03090, partial [Gemmatimonadales bacterium]